MNATLSMNDVDHAKVVSRINATLRGPVIEELARLLPTVKAIPRHQAMDKIMADPTLLHECFTAFHGNTSHFRHLMVDARRKPVTAPDAPLSCGRSFDEVVAMVVRSCARRYFTKVLDGDVKPRPRIKTVPRERSFFERLFGAEPVKKVAVRALTKAEALYRSISDYLLHEWQIPLVPTYSRLSPQQVRELGPRILEMRAVEDFAGFGAAEPSSPVPFAPSGFAATGGSAMAPPPEMAAAVSAPRDNRARIEEIVSGDGQRLRASAFTGVLLDPAVRQSVPNAAQMVRISSTLSGIGGPVSKMVVGELGLSKEQFVVLMLNLADRLGEHNFQRAFGLPGKLDYVSRMIERARACQIGQQTTLPQLTEFVAQSFR